MQSLALQVLHKYSKVHVTGMSGTEGAGLFKRKREDKQDMLAGAGGATVSTSIPDLGCRKLTNMLCRLPVRLQEDSFPSE